MGNKGSYRSDERSDENGAESLQLNEPSFQLSSDVT